ncbi:hypothetical protein J2W49_005178 [Hydrogenophaga palleronii]|uniref:IPT/TIG domain-containing protein n=2 Tax=Hydrogenophaga palleronii TaxID=65655 RepID=A0ABU1WV66_9BURK|nr:hypothetical protein [Hydrogenophaga palleronii]
MSTVISPVITVSAPELKFNRTTEMVGKGMRTYVNSLYVQRVVNGSAFSGVDALVVNLSSSDPSKVSVPASVTIPAGSSSVYFRSTGVELTQGAAVTIDATAEGYTAPAAKLQIQVGEPVLSLSGVDVSRSVGQARNGFYIGIRGPAGGPSPTNQTMATSLPVSVAIEQANPAGLVDGIYSAGAGGAAVTEAVIPAGSNSAGPVYVGTPSTTGTYRVSATTAGMNVVTSPLVTVSAPELKFNRTTEVVGKGMRTQVNSLYVQRVVNGSAFSGVDALVINLECSAPTICSVPTTVTIPAGGSSAYFQVTGAGLGDTTITAAAAGHTSAENLAVRTVDPQLVFSGPSSTSVGSQSNFSLSLTVPGSSAPNSQGVAAPTVVTLTSSAPGVASVPATATIATGSRTTSTLQLTGIAPGSTSVTASGSGLISATSGVVSVSP